MLCIHVHQYPSMAAVCISERWECHIKYTCLAVVDVSAIIFSPPVCLLLYLGRSVDFKGQSRERPSSVQSVNSTKVLTQRTTRPTQTSPEQTHARTHTHFFSIQCLHFALSCPLVLVNCSCVSSAVLHIHW